ncbi:MAG: hypothetical protein NVSMB9_20450 [Isosphaeraceae bacterium]
MANETRTPRLLKNPLEGVVLGDPYVLRHRGRFYLYGTNDGPPLPDGRMVPVYRSDDLLHWTPLGGALVPNEPDAEHWAPEVLAWNGKFFMVISFGDVDRRGHVLWVAVADRPEGPFRMERRVSDPSERFSIDGSWLLDDDGRLYLFRCVDFVDEASPPHGTGIVAQPMRDPLTPTGPPVVVLRAHSPWHLFATDRLMPLYDNRRFAAWTTIEGPAPLKRLGRYFCGYSGGNYAGAYGTGEAVADSPLGPYHDQRGLEGPIFGTTPGVVEGPGHFSVIRPDLIHDWIVLHGRLPGEPVRRVWLCPASWSAQGVTIGELTDHPQPAPDLPDDLSLFAGSTGPRVEGWSWDSTGWSLVADGLRHEGNSPGAAWRDGLGLIGDWAVEVYLAFPGGSEPGAGGLTLRSEAGELSVVLTKEDSGRVVIEGTPLAATDAPLPVLGEMPFDFRAFHTMEVRAVSGKCEVRVDGVRIALDLDAPTGVTRFGLKARGDLVFDAVSLAGQELRSVGA